MSKRLGSEEKAARFCSIVSAIERGPGTLLLAAIAISSLLLHPYFLWLLTCFLESSLVQRGQVGIIVTSEQNTSHMSHCDLRGRTSVLLRVICS